MRVLATRQFVEAARAARRPLAERVAEVVVGDRLAGSTRAGPGLRARRVGRAHVVGLSRDEDRLKLWYLVGHEPYDMAPEPPLAGVARSELRGLGVPSDVIPAVQRILMVEEIDHLAMPRDARDRLRFRFLQLTAGLGADEAALVRSADGERDLLEFLHGRVADLLLRLDPAQERVVTLGGAGTILVRGVAGSGKTAVALHRIRHLVSQRDLFQARRVLLLTYNRALAAAARELLAGLGGARVRDVEVQTVHGWAVRFAGAPIRRIMTGTGERQKMIREAIAAVRPSAPGSAVWAHPLAFWESEIHLIKGRGIEGRDAYLSLRRHGAHRPLGPGLRQVIWDVFEQHRARCSRARRLDWDDVILEAHRRMDALGETAPAYDHVFLDEAQDLTVAAIRLAARLARPPGELFIALDPAQSLYERAFRWRDAGIRVHGARSFAFTRNYRNSRSILDAARPVLRAVIEDRALAEGEDPDLVEPEAAAGEGRAPRHLPCAPFREAQAIAAEIGRLVREESVRPGNIAVLAFPNKVKRALCRDLRAQGVICQEHGHDTEIRLADPSVKVLPMKSAKGLEFPVVFVAAAGRHFAPPSPRMDAHDLAAYAAEMRRLFYVAMTRAMVDLVLVYPPEDPPRPLGREWGMGNGEEGTE